MYHRQKLLDLNYRVSEQTIFYTSQYAVGLCTNAVSGTQDVSQMVV
jgi:hypothetical protein